MIQDIEQIEYRGGMLANAADPESLAARKWRGAKIGGSIVFGRGCLSVVTWSNLEASSNAGEFQDSPRGSVSVNAVRITFPLAVRGRALRKRTWRGRL